MANIKRCIYRVWTGSYINPTRQCYRKNGYGISGEYCKQHWEIIKRRRKIQQGESDG